MAAITASKRAASCRAVRCAPRLLFAMSCDAGFLLGRDSWTLRDYSRSGKLAEHLRHVALRPPCCSGGVHRTLQRATLIAHAFPSHVGPTSSVAWDYYNRSSFASSASGRCPPFGQQLASVAARNSAIAWSSCTGHIANWSLFWFARIDALAGLQINAEQRVAGRRFVPPATAPAAPTRQPVHSPKSAGKSARATTVAPEISLTIPGFVFA
jgi:hypothetical protein